MELDTLRDEARELHDETVALRRTLHRWPELGNDLPVTRDGVRLLAVLQDFGASVLHEIDGFHFFIVPCRMHCDDSSPAAAQI